jgi:mannose-6-phosphate isomerase-like protein (cupin superfamily)
MLKVSRQSAEHIEDHGPVEDRHQDGDGYTINFITFKMDIDGTPLLKGLPGDNCSCPHWGYVISGRMTYVTDEGEHVVETGDAFYLPPGHIPKVTAGTEFVQFSPTEQLEKVSRHMTEAAKRMQAAGAPG